MKIKNIKLYSQKKIKEKRFFIISDLHISNKKSANIEKMLTISESLKVDCTLIPGDIINDSRYLNDSEFCEKLAYIFAVLCKNNRVICSLGNHDIMSIEKNKWNPANKKRICYFLKMYTDAIVLDNERYFFEDIAIDALNLPFEYYEGKNNFDSFNYYNSIFNNERGNILLTHAVDEEIIKFISSQYDAVISGHMHNGGIPPVIDFIPGNFGLIGASGKIFPKYARGIVNGKVLINGPINGFHDNDFLSNLYGSTGTVLTLKQKAC